MEVTSQVADALPENVMFRKQRVELAVLHVVGSNDDLQPWTGVGNSDHPMASGSPLLARYTALGVTGSAADVERITVDGSNNNVDWLRVIVNRPGADETLSWERVPYTS